MRKADIEILRELLDPDKMDLRCAIIQDLEIPEDRSVVLVTVNIVPEGVEMVARMSWEHVGPDAGIFQFPSKNDLVLVSFCEGDEDEAFVIRRLTSKEDKIPLMACDGHFVLRARAGTKTFLNSDTEINLTRGEVGTEQLVLGNTFQAAYADHLGSHIAHLEADIAHDHLGNIGYNTSPPTNVADYQMVKSDIEGVKASPVDDSLMLSDLAKTEK